jgi:hypothetical protein
MNPNEPQGVPPCLVEVDLEGKFWHKGAEIFRENILEIFFENVTQDEWGRYIIVWQGKPCYVDVADTYFVVWRVEEDASGALILTLNDGRSEPLAPDTLKMGPENVLYCRVKDNQFPARFARKAYYQLAEKLGEEDGRFFIELGGQRHYLA